MPKEPLPLLRFSVQEQHYILTPVSLSLGPEVTSSQQTWTQWLNTISSFAFENREGTHCTIRKERFQRGDAYWYAYRSVNGRTRKRYLGRTVDLTFTRLEKVSAHFTAQVQETVQAVPTDLECAVSIDPEPSFVFAPLLESKLHPSRLPARLVERPQLLELLDSGHDRKVTLLQAPAGFGKTTLILQWLAYLKKRVVSGLLPPLVSWLSLDRGDNDPIRFWSSLITACQVNGETLGQNALAHLFQIPHWPFPPSPFEMALMHFLNDLGRIDAPLILILEDYHLIEYVGIHETMTYFVEHLPAHVRLIILSRSTPPLPLLRWRARGDLLDVQTGQLRFTTEEAAIFLQQTTMQQFSQDAVHNLSIYIEGWAAGLRLLAISWQRAKTPQAIEEVFSRLNTGTEPEQPHRLLQEYFLSEILLAQPEELQLFLLQTSILSRLTGSLCDVVTGRQDSAEWLETTFRSGFFLEALERRAFPSIAEQEWYRYHSIFASTLRAEAVRRLGEEALCGLSEKASHWYEAHGMLVEAIDAAFSARISEQAARLIEQLNEHIYFSEHHTMLRWLEQLPPPCLRAHPMLCFLFAQACFFTGTAPLGKEQINDLLRMAEEGFCQQENVPFLSTVAALRAAFAINEGHGSLSFAVTHAHQALHLLPFDSEQSGKFTQRQTSAWIDWRIGCLITLGGESMQSGSFEQAYHYFLEAYTRSQESEKNVFTGVMGAMLGETCIELGRLHQAASYYQQTLAQQRSPNEAIAHAAARCGLARLAYEWNDLETAWNHVARSEQLVSEALDNHYIDHHWAEEVLTNVELVKILLLHERGESILAQQAISALYVRLQTIASPNTLLLIPDVLNMQARLHIRNGNLSAASRTLDTLAGYKQMISPLQQQTQQLLYIRLNLVQGESEVALPILHQFLTVAQHNGYLSRICEIHLLLALAYFDLKQEKAARQHLSLVLSQAHSEGYLRLFLAEGEPLAVMLRSLLPTMKEKSLSTYVRTILQAFTASSDTTIDQDQSEHLALKTLSTQEQRVLRLLIAGYSNPEIAESLIVSVNTIKAHVKNIYRKLGVTNRVEASEIARRASLT